MADINFTARYGDPAPSAANNTSTVVSANIVKIGADTTYDFRTSRRTSSFLGKDCANVMALWENCFIEFLDYQSNKTS